MAMIEVHLSWAKLQDLRKPDSSASLSSCTASSSPANPETNETKELYGIMKTYVRHISTLTARRIAFFRHLPSGPAAACRSKRR